MVTKPRKRQTRRVVVVPDPERNVTQIYQSKPPRLFLKEHREAKGVSAEQMGGRINIERESVYRLERKPERVTWERQCQWADALGISPLDLHRPPGAPSLDAMVAPAPEDLQKTVRDVVKRLVSGGG